MKYKPSKYMHMVVNKQNELILYNALYGTNSLCKIRDSKGVTHALKNGIESIDGELSDVMNSLVQRGYLVEEWKNEEALFNFKKAQMLSPKNLSLTIVIAGECNFKCVYCHDRYGQSTISLETQEKIVDYIRRNIQQYTGLHISWFGGEPLLAMDIIEDMSRKMMDICRKNKKPYSASMTTNGYYLNLDVFNRLRRVNVLSYQITLDGSQETHDSRRFLADGSGTYNKIFDNLTEISASITSFMYNFAIRVNMTIDMLDDIPLIVNTHLTCFGADPRFRLLFHPVTNFGGESVKSLSHIMGGADMMRQIYHILLEYPKLPYLSLVGLDPFTAICYAGVENNWWIDPEGIVHKCSIYFTNPDTKDRCSMGNIDALGKHQDYSYLLAEWVHSSSTVCPSLDNCFFAPVCMGEPCPAKRIFSPNHLKEECPKKDVDLLILLLDRQEPLIFID